MPRSISAFWIPRSSTPALSCHTFFQTLLEHRSGDCCTASSSNSNQFNQIAYFNPRSIRPVATVPRPVIEKTSSQPSGRAYPHPAQAWECRRLPHPSSRRSCQPTHFPPRRLGLESSLPRPATQNRSQSGCRPWKIVTAQQVADFKFHEFKLLVIHHVFLIQETTRLERRPALLAGYVHGFEALGHLQQTTRIHHPFEPPR